MKLTTFFRLTISVLFATGCIEYAIACGPFTPIIPTPEFFKLSEPHKAMSYYEREENLKLWQALTSERIPLADIEEVVYHDSWDIFFNHTSYKRTTTTNLFYTYLNNSQDSEIIEFLETAKALEERWKDMRSPWFYPQDRETNGETGDFSGLIERLRGYDGVRLRDRYALQISRALFASRQYAACIEYSDSAFADIPNSNLMKRMAQRYVAGCWSRLGEKQRADSIFAKTGDIWSISGNNPIEFMSRLNPNAPQIIEYIREKASNPQFMHDMIPVVQQLLRDANVKNKGDWNFLLAYIYNEFNQDIQCARKEIYHAMQQTFSTDELKDLARAYKMKIDGQTGNLQTLLSDIRWLENKTDILNPDAEQWIRRCRNIIYVVDWVPQLWKKKNYSTAILLCSYADNLTSSGQWHKVWGNMENRLA